MKVIDRPDLIGPSYKHNNHRVERQAEIENAISGWTSARSAEEVETILNEVGVPVGRVCTVKEIVEGEQIKARGGVEDVWVPNSKGRSAVAGAGVGGKVEGEDGWTMKMPMVAPILEGCDPKTKWAGPDLGMHNEDVLVDHLGLSEKEVRDLVDRGIVGAFTSKVAQEQEGLKPDMGAYKRKVDTQALGK